MKLMKGGLLLCSAVATVCGVANSQAIVEAPKPTLVPLEIFTVPKNLEVTLWAQSPQLRQPSNIDVDAQGRVWVTEAMNYRRHAGKDPAGSGGRLVTQSLGCGGKDRRSGFDRAAA